jgi:hypothetical protein
LIWTPKSGRGPIALRTPPPSSAIRRHKRKYAEGTPRPEASFFFKGPAGKLNLRAQNLNVFVQMAEGVDDETWTHHLRQGDYSRWIHQAIKDDALAKQISEIEKNGKESPQRTRAAVIEAISRRYTHVE